MNCLAGPTTGCKRMLATSCLEPLSLNVINSVNTIFPIKGMNMNCPKCNRKVPGNKKTCLYCGESLSRQLLSKNHSAMSNINGFHVQSKTVEKIDLSDLPADIKAKVEDAFRKGQKSVTIQDESRILKYPFDGTADKRIELSIDDTLSLLAGIRDSYEQSNIKTAEYEQMVLDIIQNYLASINDGEKINFVVNGILDSDFMSFLNDGMLKKLRGSIIESVSNKI